MRTEAAIVQIEKMGFRPFHHEGELDIVKVSAEEGDGAADYWGSYELFNGGIHRELQGWAEKNGLYWEWVNPGCIAAYPIDR